MSQIDESNKRNRSVKLCQLVYDRQIDKEICFEIRTLLEEGVLIDFHDQNRNKKTALHLAVEKGDVVCVKFLLHFNPGLQEKDGDGKTPVELAESSDHEGIRNVLLNSTFDVANELYIEEFDFESLSLQKIGAIKSKATFKVLKLTNCLKVNDVWMKLNDHGYTTTFNESSHFFFIAIETKESNIQNDREMMTKALNLQRPMIVQLSSSDSRSTKIYFKDDKKDFVEITDTTQITQEEFNESVQSDDECNLKLLVAALRSDLFGHFTSNLLDTKLNNNEDRNQAVNQFARANTLCHRFFKLFNEVQPQIDRVVAALSFKGVQSLLALLDLPFEFEHEKPILSEHQQYIVSIVDPRGFNLLMMAAEQDNLDAMKLLLHCNCDINHLDNYDNCASDICWNFKAFNCLAELIEAGAPYPNNFLANVITESSEACERINKIIEAINSFHENIEQGEIEEVRKFIINHPHIKHAYNTNNKSALTVALQSNKVDIYSLLLSEGFEPGVDDEYQSACSESKFKNEIRNSHRKYFKDAFSDPHLKRLQEKSKLSFGSKDQAKCSKIIRKMFDELNEIDELIPILQICSLSDKLRIIFDFNCDSVSDMVVETGSTSFGIVKGIVYPFEGSIYIGAKNHGKEFCKVIGILIHELAHYALQLKYQNNCKPYDEDDIENKNLFDNITGEIHEIRGRDSFDPIFTIVFKCYHEQRWHQELIVRVPQLLAHYKMNPQALQAAERNTPKLFQFYREKTLKDLASQDKTWLQEYLISEINNQAETAEKIKNLNVQFENVAITLESSVNIITSNAPQLTMAMLNQVYEPDSNIFVTLEQVAIGNILDKIAKINSKKTALIVDCILLAQKYPESLQKLMKGMKNVKTIALVLTEAESSKVKENFPKVEFKTLTHKWGELTESSKVNLLNQNVIFQGVEIKLNKLVEPLSEAMNFFPLGELVDCKDFKIGNELHETLNNFYVPRKFIKIDQRHKANPKSFAALQDDDAQTDAMIISDEAGSGKSLTLFEVAKSLHVAYSDRWVLFVDLKRHIEAFKSNENYEKIKTFEDFIVENILKNEPEFDRELFMQMFRDGKTFVLFDGFDEISPNYKDLLLHALKFFKRGSGNRLCITTRPHLETDLEDALRCPVFKLEELSEEDQRSFLNEYWKSIEVKSEDIEVLSNRLLAKFSEIANTNIVGLPLLLRMTAEIFENPIKENWLHKVDSLNITLVFREFVEKYLARWKEDRNELSRSILEIHHSIAIKHKFGGKFAILEVDAGDAEKIAKVGLIRYDKNEKTFQIIHETFAQYFVADFIWFHLPKLLTAALQ